MRGISTGNNHKKLRKIQKRKKDSLCFPCLSRHTLFELAISSNSIFFSTSSFLWVFVSYPSHSHTSNLKNDFVPSCEFEKSDNCDETVNERRRCGKPKWVKNLEGMGTWNELIRDFHMEKASQIIEFNQFTGTLQKLINS